MVSISKDAVFVVATLATLLDQALGKFYAVVPGTVANSSISTLAPSCVNSIEAEVNCDEYLQLQADADVYGADNVTQATVCTAACSSSLSSYLSEVESNCKGQPLPWDNMPHGYFGKVLQSTYNMSCLQDPATGQYCTRKLRYQALPSSTHVGFHLCLELTRSIRGVVELRQCYYRRAHPRAGLLTLHAVCGPAHPVDFLQQLR